MKIITNKLVSDSQISTNNLQRWLYSLGNLGCAIPYQTIGAVILFFYVDVQKLSPVWAATVMTGDVTLSGVIDEDEIRTGQRREGGKRLKEVKDTLKNKHVMHVT